MRKIHFTSILMLLSGILFSGCRSVEPKSAAPPEVLAEFDFQSEMNYIILPVTFQGQEYPFVLDTGATNTIFDESMKDKLGKRFLWPKKATLAHGKKAKVEYFKAPEAYLGSLELKCSNLIGVLDLDFMFKSMDSRTIQGVVGMDFLQKYIVQIDFDNKKVTFFKGKKDRCLFSSFRSKENKHPEWGEPILLKTKLFNRQRHIKGKLLNDIPAEFMIDSGWQSHGALDGRLYKKVNPKLTFDAVHRDDLTTPVESDIGLKMIEKFSVGPFEYNNNIFQKSNKSLLGLPFLSHHVITFDFPNNVMYLRKGERFGEQFGFSSACTATGFVTLLRDNNLFVSYVDPNGPAYEKGIKQNDIVLKIQANDYILTSFSAMEFMEFLSRLPKDENITYSFTLKRGEEIINASFSKKDMMIKNDEND